MSEKRRRRRALKRAQINEIRQRLRDWYTRFMGRTLLDMERDQLAGVLTTVFGYHAIQVGCLLGDDLLALTRITHRVVMDPDPTENICTQVYAYPDALPVMSDSVDLVILPHTLEFERMPHEILREADRVLIPEGHVVILGFNPWSFWGLRRLFTLWRQQPGPPWCGHFLSMTRTKDWLALLGFDVIHCSQFFYRPPIQHEPTMRRLRFMEKLGARFWPRFGGAYLLVARKRVVALTPIKPRWRPRRALVGDLAEPTAHRVHDG